MTENDLESTVNEAIGNAQVHADAALERHNAALDDASGAIAALRVVTNVTGERISKDIPVVCEDDGHG